MPSDRQVIVAHLHVNNHPNISMPIPIFQGENTVGRNPAKAMVCVKDAQVSQKHALITVKDDKIVLVDVGSKNGTFLDLESRERIAKGEKFTIDEKQKFSFGSIVCFIEKAEKNKETLKQEALNNLLDSNSNAFEQLMKNDKNVQKVLEKQENEETEYEDEKEPQQSVKKTITAVPPKEKKPKAIKKVNNQKQAQKNKKTNVKKQQTARIENKRQKLQVEQQKPQKKVSSEKNRSFQSEKPKSESLKSKRSSKSPVKKPSKQKKKSTTVEHQKPKKQSKEKKKKSQAKNDSDNETNPKQRKNTSSQTKVKKAKKQIRTSRKRAPNSTQIQTTQNHISINQGRISVAYKTRKRFVKVTRFMISGTNITFSVNPQLKYVTDINQKFDVLVMETYIRTFKLLYAISKGVPIVTKSWLLESQHYKMVMSFDTYWLQVPEEKDLLKKSITLVQEGHRVFEGLKFYIASDDQSLHVELQKLERLIYACGGYSMKILVNNKTSNKDHKDVIVILQNDFSKHQAYKAKSVNKDKVYSIELLLDGCLRQEINWDKYKLDL